MLQPPPLCYFVKPYARYIVALPLPTSSFVDNVVFSP